MGMQWSISSLYLAYIDAYIHDYIKALFQPTPRPSHARETGPQTKSLGQHRGYVVYMVSNQKEGDSRRGESHGKKDDKAHDRVT